MSVNINIRLLEGKKVQVIDGLDVIMDVLEKYGAKRHFWGRDGRRPYIEASYFLGEKRLPVFTLRPDQKLMCSYIIDPHAGPRSSWEDRTTNHFSISLRKKAKKISKNDVEQIYRGLEDIMQ